MTARCLELKWGLKNAQAHWNHLKRCFLLQGMHHRFHLSEGIYKHVTNPNLKRFLSYSQSRAHTYTDPLHIKTLFLDTLRMASWYPNRLQQMQFAHSRHPHANVVCEVIGAGWDSPGCNVTSAALHRTTTCMTNEKTSKTSQAAEPLCLTQVWLRSLSSAGLGRLCLHLHVFRLMNVSPQAPKVKHQQGFLCP